MVKKGCGCLLLIIFLPILIVGALILYYSVLPPFIEEYSMYFAPTLIVLVPIIIYGSYLLLKRRKENPVNKINSLVHNIEKFSPVEGRENYISDRLSSHLAKSKYKVRREVTLEKGDRIDLLIEDPRVIVEAKRDLGSDPYTVEVLKGKVFSYLQRYPEYKIIIVIYGNARGDEVEELYKTLPGVRVIVLGKVRQRGEKLN